MPFYADLHIHSKYSRACSRDCDLEHLAWWARRKGVTVVGTGDFTHPAWFEELRGSLEPAEPGLFRLRAEQDREVERTLPPSCRRPVRFMLSVVISTIYKRGERTRKVHHLVYVPDLGAAERFNRHLGRIGNIRSDGRPILGLDSRDLLEIALESGAGSYLVPAHVWTPWFAVLGSKSGFDTVEDCYADLAGHVFALETGLSSDPAMNWRVSSLDRYRLVSNSDAHSPPGQVPGLRKATHDRRAAPGRGARGPAAGRAAGGCGRLPQPGAAAGGHGRDPTGRTQEQGGRPGAGRADRPARPGARHSHRGTAGRGRSGRLPAARRGHRPAPPGPGAPRGRLRRRVRRDPPVQAERAGAPGRHRAAVRALAGGRARGPCGAAVARRRRRRRRRRGRG